MPGTFAASVAREGSWFVAQCLEVDVASQGATEQDAVGNLHDALEFPFQVPVATMVPEIRTVEITIDAD